ncbi:VanZ family protein [Streptomyces sp. ADI97-07]|uniref:VanZ family protein n=1 Tax=Streptomyces sp. ADI97-07 TaxID=1522762 RepID=UPI000F553938|nr:VanZ family protein [Streptomyces sp. ADI97-07]
MTAEADGRARRGRLGRLLLRAVALAVAFLGLVAFSFVLAKITLTPSPASEDLVTSNLQPGRSLRQYAEDYTFLAACKQAGGNLLLGVPFGILLPIMVPRRLRMVRMALLTVLVMAVIELVQGALVAGRAFDIDDVILNTSGALLGYIVLGRRVSHRYHTLLDEPPAADTAKAPPAAKEGAKRTNRAWAARKARVGTASVPESRPASGKRARSETKAVSGSKAAGRARPEAAAGRSASAPVARGRALIARWRSGRPGPGGGAPGAGRNGT